jgi:phospholipid/cholesterol/gamma-HCH transport system ATP-binding protein
MPENGPNVGVVTGLPKTAPVEIRAEDLHKAFNGHAVLRGIDTEIRSGDLVALVGGSGCGKTVLLNHFLALLTPDRGRVLVADHGQDGAPLVDLGDLDTLEIDRIHTYWGVVFQRNALFSGTVFDNIALWLQEIEHRSDAEITPIAQRVLRAVDLPDDEDFLALGVDHLSGGMAKRLAVARALAMDPLVMFYDEPTTGLDPTSASQIQDLVLSTHQAPRREGQRTTIIITHDKDLLRRLEPRIVMLHEGKILFDGRFADFEASRSPEIRPYFELMPTLHLRAAAS